jgi:glycoside/pentoside/hexuronide:cation symporter, GPH family
MNQQKLPIKIKIGYGVCDLGGNLFFTIVAFLLLNYLTDTVGISAGLAGVVIMVGKVWDAITDPVVGYLSDRTRTKWGRRRPYMLFGSFPLFVAMVLMFTNPKLDSQGQLVIWGIIVYCLLCTAYTLVNIPYNSMTPELTKDFHERSSLNGYRFGFAVIGTLLGAGAALPLIGLFADKNTGFTAMGAFFGFLMMITAMITVFMVKEPQLQAEKPQIGFFKTYLGVFRNRPYVIILLTYTFHITALTIVAGVMIYYFKYVHRNESVTTIAMLILLLTAMVFIPPSIYLAKRIGKKATYGLGMAILSLSIMILFFLGHRLGLQFSLATMFLCGIGMGFLYALPYAIVPDAVEYDYLLTGSRAEGAFYGIWTFGIKIGQALALGITGAVLSFVGYIPDVVQSEASLFGIRLLMGPISATIFIIAIAVLYFYPINEQRYNEILEQIGEMEKQKAMAP